MSAKFIAGTAVKQVLPEPIKGAVKRFAFDELTGEISYVVGWTDDTGVEHERVFTGDQIEAQ